MLLLRSLSDSPAYHGALEEYLLTERSFEDVLLFYINRPSVIVGRNQTIEAEVDAAYCRRQGIEIVRRMSGGGTVYHDRGNINYAFIADKDATPVLDRDFTAPVVEALASLGIRATSGPRKELLCDGYKISGTASHVTRTRQLFHGTLLYDTDLDALSLALRGDGTRRGKGVPSVPSPVANLHRLRPQDETTEDFLGLLVGYFARRHGTAPRTDLPSEETLRAQGRMREGR
ncbi:lipoate--protein ligase family protein [uncultured Alistipes sp.]|uniref:lipoate--protein ligase family protein n=1 Tax=uncultured Alistipes sp. TaxID=538949 RepID=UPI0026332956|nr:lipoate--protein ligase family protein [uncultured Alistipes sp.]